jgi:outer membrane protein insertion porin family
VVRILPYLIIATLTSVAIAQEYRSVSDRSDGEKPAQVLTLESDGLTLLEQVALPLESGPPPARTANGDLNGLEGRTVTRIGVAEAIAGFDPASEADIPLGIRLDAELVRRAVLRLWDSGKYREVMVYAEPGPGESVELILAVKPMLRVRRFTVEGNDALSDDEVARACGYTAGRTILPEPDVMRELKRKLLEAYSKRGYQEVSAKLSIETTRTPGGVALIVEVEEGRPERYTRIKFPGLPEEFTATEIARSIDLRRKSLRDRELVDRRVKTLDKILAESGYLDASIQAREERRIGRYRIELSIPIDAGIHTEIVFHGNEHFRQHQLLKRLMGKGLLRTSPESVERGIVRLREHYQRYGFFLAKFEANRHCIGEDGSGATSGIDTICPKYTTAQRLNFTVVEGPVVEVAQVIFSGNAQFEDEDLEGELLAFVKERNQFDGLFQPLTTDTLDDLGLSDKRPQGLGRSRGAKAPRSRQDRSYLPDVYLESMDHLVGLYQEQGYLEVEVSDMCDLDRQKTHKRKKDVFTPFRFDRQTEDTAESDDQTKSPCVMINQDHSQLLVYVAINEGPQTNLSEINFEGNTVFPSLTLQEVAGLSISSPYNEYRLHESAKRLNALYRSSGYMFAEVSWQEYFSSDMRSARVSFQFVEGPQVRVGQIRVEGAEVTSKKLIRERLTVESGDLITPEEIEESQTRLMELGILDSATIQLVSPEIAAEVKNLKVQVTEGKPQYLELRGGIATVEGLRGGFEYGYRNLAGWAMSARLRARANYRLFFFGNEDFASRYENELTLIEQLEHHILVGVGSPHFPGSKGLLGWGVDVTKEQVNEPSFSIDRITGFIRVNSTIAFGQKYRRGFVVEARTGLEISDLALPQEFATLQANPMFSNYLRLPDGESAFWVTGLGLTFDLRNDPFNPTRGIFVSLGGDWVRSLSIFDYDDPGEVSQADEEIERKSNLIRTRITASGYIPLFGTDMVLAISFMAGYVFHLEKDSTTWSDRYFYLGGVDTIRGFAEDSLLPEDLYQAWKSSLQDYSDDADELLSSRGGEAMLVIRAELRYPLAKGFYGALFGELGNLWRDREKMKVIGIDPFDFHLRPVAGGGIRYMTPLGPLSFDLGINLFRRPHEEPFAWYFSIGTAF